MIKIRQNATRILNENKDSETSLKDEHDKSKLNDPTYLAWLFNDGDLGDYGMNMTAEHLEILEEFEKYEL